MSNINDFKSKFIKGGARTSRFRVKINNPANPTADIDVPFVCHSASLPEFSLKTLELSYFGRKINVGSVKDYGEWSVKIYNDETFNVRNAFEQWVNSINSTVSNINQFGTSDPASYKSVAEVDQLSQTDEVLRTYKIIGIIPKKIGSIELSWNEENIEEFDVSFAMDYFYVSSSIDGKTGGDN